MRHAAFPGLALLAAACAAPETPPAVDPFAVTRDDSCYTVDLFTKPEFVTPNGAVPDEWRGFTGRWGGGAWQGEWCHDLYVLSIEEDGTAAVIETHAPYAPWGKLATAFRRTARIGEDGRMRLAYGRVQVEYWVENGALYGLRREAGNGAQRVMLVRRDA